jgi:small subunit ribosomal protein S20
MANTTSAKKRVRRDLRKTRVNSDRRNRLRTFIKNVESAIASGDKDAANEALKAAQPEIMRGVTRGVVAKNTAARKVSRLSKRIKAL